jgi:uncharacterized protein YecT (DUF1311 family)
MSRVRLKFIAPFLIAAFMLALFAKPVSAQAQAGSSSAQADYASAMVEYQRIHIRPTMMKCLDKANANNYLDQQCYQAESIFQNRRINEAYKILLTHMDSKAKLKLRDEEREWIKHRDSECALSDADTGQSNLLDRDECLISETAKRATELESRLSDSE